MPVERNFLGGIETNTFTDINDVVVSIENDLAGIWLSAGELAGIIGFEGVKHAKNITARRLPSGGGSYKDTIDFDADFAGTENKNGVENEIRVTLYSNHEWAAAIEYGTKPHPIDAKFGGLASKLAKDYYKDLIEEVNKNRSPKAAPVGMRSDRYKIEKKKFSDQGGASYTPGRRKGKNIISMSETYDQLVYDRIEPNSKMKGKYKEYHFDTEMHDSPWLDLADRRVYARTPKNLLEVQEFLGHELGHFYGQSKNKRENTTFRRAEKRMNKKEGSHIDDREFFAVQTEQYMGRKIRDMINSGKITGVLGRKTYNNPGTKDAKYEGIRKIDQRFTWDIPDEKVARWTNARLAFSKVVPGGSKGANIKSGVKYDESKTFYATHVDHPGARAFLIFTDTQVWINEHLDDFISRSWQK